MPEDPETKKEETEEVEKSVDEKVGAVQKVADAVLSKVLDRMRATADSSGIDELIEKNLEADNYEDTLRRIARRKSAVAAEVSRVADVQKHAVGLAAWAVAKGSYEKDSDPCKYLAEWAGVEATDTRDIEVSKGLGIMSPRLTQDPAIRKTIQISTPDAGGVLTTGDRVDDFFRPLRNQAVVLSMGPVIRNIIDGAVTVTGLETDVAITWDNEVGTQEIKDEPTWGERKRATSFARVLVPISRKALRSRASAQVVSDVNDSISHAFVIGYDQKFINGIDGDPGPKGLRAFSSTPVATNGKAFDNIVDDAKGAMSRMAQNSVPMRNLGWLMSKREKVHLEFLRDTNDLFPFKPEIQNGTWFGAQLGSTNEIAVTEGGGGDESFVLLTDFSGVLVGIGTEVTINQWDQASYTVNATIKNPVERGEVVVTAEAETVMIVPQAEFIEEISGVQWGA